ncbi:sugar ABC transporter substrate-binding protein [Bacillus suaedaesalsae]|uniref:Substrate-binding domain-containing protein n=1 Tax=Bacillus suaedaesalsae TaxID=2810349 RepID=A0ABS2DCI5_9BACI|nr:substrate-binding domain-containing protein [Bacillus suaedaesalsae]MBM6616175.1 substrate-binding domain-containing protein [Bacillus suaedaesalsae]
MRKLGIILLSISCLVLCYFTVVSAEKVFRPEWELPKKISEKEDQYRLVLITQELETPFWDLVGLGAREQAEKEGVSFEVWGSYGKNQEEFLKKIDIAIHSKVDGIIVQGSDTDEFINLTKVKAAFYGIPIITVANDVPIEKSLRRTYVGSDQYSAGKMIAQQLVSDMGEAGKVVLLGDSNQEFYQKQRLQGIQEILKKYSNIDTVYAETEDTREQVIVTTRDLLNRTPDADAFIAINANNTGAMIQEISKRSQIEPYFIYSFDDGPESLSLLSQGKLDGMIEQSPERMGQISVSLTMKWLKGETVPLDMNGYLTDIRILKAMNK